jgi:hypothetical protein
VIVNQVAIDGADDFMDKVISGQDKIIKQFEGFAEEEGIKICKVELTDEEPKSEFGLRTLWGNYERKLD